MTDGEKLDLILEKVNGLDAKVSGLDTKVSGFETKLSGLDAKVSGLELEMQVVNSRLDKIDDKINTLGVWQRKTVRQVEELHVAQKLYELNTNKKLDRLQDGMDTIVEILKLNDLIPRS